jgi:hypothetical protein
MKEILKFFMPEQQLNRLAEDLKRDTDGTVIKKVGTLKDRILNMPGPYETDGKGDHEVVLHYFINGSHWFIIERDSTEEQFQAFGYACLHGNYQFAELGYISIRELIRHNVELDLHWEPQKLSVVKGYMEKMYSDHKRIDKKLYPFIAEMMHNIH